MSNYVFDKKIIDSKLKELIWLPLTGIRWSYGTLFLEIWKELYIEEYDYKRTAPMCEHHFMIDPNWRFTKKNKVLFSCDSVDRRVFHTIMKKFIWLKIITIEIYVICWISELLITFEWDIQFLTFSTMDHNPYGWWSWSLYYELYTDQKNRQQRQSKYRISNITSAKEVSRNRIWKPYLFEKQSI